jgi:formamidopyrimidine-DNA glycosylase
MPELAEVESLCRGLNAVVGGRSIESVSRISTSFGRKPFNGLVGLVLIAFERHGKFVMAKLSDRTRLLIHFGMSGRLVVRPPSKKHDHIALRFEHGVWVTFNDFRKFGRIWRIAETQIWTEPPLSKLGPDALTKSFSSKTLDINSRRSVKSILPDQGIVAGLGNIYSSESLYRAGLLPTRAVSSLSAHDRKRLVRAIKSTLHAAARRGGSTLDDYRGTEGQSGDYDRYFSVFSKEGHPCPKCTCETGIKRIIQQGRSTYYCPTLQR